MDSHLLRCQFSVTFLSRMGEKTKDRVTTLSNTYWARIFSLFRIHLWLLLFFFRVLFFVHANWVVVVCKQLDIYGTGSGVTFPPAKDEEFAARRAKNNQSLLRWLVGIDDSDPQADSRRIQRCGGGFDGDGNKHTHSLAEPRRTTSCTPDCYHGNGQGVGEGG